MIKYIFTGLLISVLFLGFNGLLSQDNALPSLQGKKVLFVYGGWYGHEPMKCLNLFVPWMESEGATVDTSASLDVYLEVEKMKSYDLIMQIYTMSEISNEQDVDTVGGLVFSLLGHVPRKGQEVQYQQLLFTVLDAEHRKINRLKVELQATTNGQDAEQD